MVGNVWLMMIVKDNCRFVVNEILTHNAHLTISERKVAGVTAVCKRVRLDLIMISHLDLLDFNTNAANFHFIHLNVLNQCANSLKCALTQQIIAQHCRRRGARRAPEAPRRFAGRPDRRGAEDVKRRGGEAGVIGGDNAGPYTLQIPDCPFAVLFAVVLQLILSRKSVI